MPATQILEEAEKERSDLIAMSTQVEPALPTFCTWQNMKIEDDKFLLPSSRR